MARPPEPFQDRRKDVRRIPRRGLLARLRRAAEAVLWPYPTLNLSARTCYQRIRERELGRGKRGRYLIVGSGIDEGVGVRELGPEILSRTIHLDVERFERVSVVGDARSLPFGDRVFDGVFCQSVLQLMLDPLLAFAEMGRVLRPGGVIFVETPFMQPHLDSSTDSSRLTLSAVREALRDFEEIDAGPSMGPSSTLAWVLREYVTTWVSPNPRWNNAVRFFLNFPIFPMRYLDVLLNRREGAHLLAASVYFLGEKPLG